jgi:hypothetical protein
LGTTLSWAHSKIVDTTSIKVFWKRPPTASKWICGTSQRAPLFHRPGHRSKYPSNHNPEILLPTRYACARLLYAAQRIANFWDVGNQIFQNFEVTNANSGWKRKGLSDVHQAVMDFIAAHPTPFYDGDWLAKNGYNTRKANDEDKPRKDKRGYKLLQ